MRSPKVYVIASVAKNGVIGNHGKLAWRNAVDLKYFRSLTLHLPVIMGRVTHESIGKVLPKRDNIVVSRNPAYQSHGVRVASSLNAALNMVTANIVWVIGGHQLYKEALPIASSLYLTEIDQDIEGDTFFPDYAKSDWIEVDREPQQGFSFVVYEKKRGY